MLSMVESESLANHLSWQLRVAAKARLRGKVDVGTNDGEAGLLTESALFAVVLERAHLGRQHHSLLPPTGAIEARGEPIWT
eukprot:5629611-Prymnesium_polylepis.1